MSAMIDAIVTSRMDVPSSTPESKNRCPDSAWRRISKPYEIHVLSLSKGTTAVSAHGQQGLDFFKTRSVRPLARVPIHRISNPQVAGSSPAGDANQINLLALRPETMSQPCCTR
jgi:hypothetical protein